LPSSCISPSKSTGTDLKKDRLTIRQILAISKYVGFSLEETMDYFFADFDAKRYNLSRKIIREGKKNAKT